MLETYFRSYTLDNGKKVNIQIRYEDGTGINRLERGGFSTQSTDVTLCNLAVPRKRLKPRAIITTDQGIVFFKTHAKWLEFINDDSNKDKILKVIGEEYSCYVLQWAS